MDIKISKAKHNDWEIIQTLNHKILSPLNKELDPHFNPDWEYTKYGQDYFKNIVTNSDIFTLIVYAKENPIGYLNGTIQCYPYRVKNSQKVGIIENIAVLPGYQSQGVGSKLISHFKKWCKTQNTQLIQINSYSGNKKAISFYKKFGLKELDTTLEGKI